MAKVIRSKKKTTAVDCQEKIKKLKKEILTLRDANFELSKAKDKISEDEEKYRRMFPQISDQDDVKLNKLTVIRRILAQKFEDDRKTLGKAGYDVTPFDELKIPASLFDDRLENVNFNEQDKQAYEWANKNPKDPRAIKIKILLNKKYGDGR